jgi:hypothetical protein
MHRVFATVIGACLRIDDVWHIRSSVMPSFAGTSGGKTRAPFHATCFSAIPPTGVPPGDVGPP